MATGYLTAYCICKSQKLKVLCRIQTRINCSLFETISAPIVVANSMYLCRVDQVQSLSLPILE